MRASGQGHEKRVGFVVTNYNNSLLTRQMVDSINACSNAPKIDIVVVDNCSVEHEVCLARDIGIQNANVVLIENDVNEGYFAGLNTGIRSLPAPISDYSVIVIGNNDLVFDGTFFENLSNIGHAIREYPVIAPNIITLDGIHQNPHVVDPPTRLRLLLWEIYYSNYFFARCMVHIRRWLGSAASRGDESQNDQAGEVLEGYGACYLLTPLFFKSFQQLWAPTFLMGEEFFLAKQIQTIGYNTYYEPSLLVTHHDHASVQNIPKKHFWRISRESHKVYLQYAEKYGFHKPIARSSQ